MFKFKFDITKSVEHFEKLASTLIDVLEQGITKAKTEIDVLQEILNKTETAVNKAQRYVDILKTIIF